ncbi:MAG: hypothetical protein Q9159_006482 [Coniocarpon cinnabarinum]
MAQSVSATSLALLPLALVTTPVLHDIQSLLRDPLLHLRETSMDIETIKVETEHIRVAAVHHVDVVEAFPEALPGDPLRDVAPKSSSRSSPKTSTSTIYERYLEHMAGFVKLICR